MPSFLHPALLETLGASTFFVVVVPVLIHLINTMRHRRVEWAAMEFLLVSQKKNRNWIIIKQLLLLLLRMAAVALVVLVIAQPLIRNQWGNLLGGSRTHHIVLFDDSFSMSDRWADTDAYSEAKKVVERLGNEAARQVEPQVFTLLRFSQAGLSQRGTQPDLLKEPVGADFPTVLSNLLAKLKVTETAAGPVAAVQSIEQLLGTSDGDRRVVYIISDFRAREWNDPTDLRKAFEHLNEAGAEIHLIHCIDKSHPNLAIASLTAVDGVQAAGVPWFMEAAVQNFSDSTVRNVSVLLSEDGHARPAATLAEVLPGHIGKERFLVHFQTPGPHQITAKLESDAVAIDNNRYFTVDIPADVPALLIDGDARASDAKFLSWALSPGGAVRTGVLPQIETPRFLGTKPLNAYHAICLANIDRLEQSAVNALEQYVANGGGVAFFLGERCQTRFFNDSLYRDGQGLFPVPLSRETELLVDRLEPAPDVQIEPHFLFRVFSEKRNTFLQTIAVQRYFAVPDSWQPPVDSSVQVLARLRNGAPLVVERAFGEGRVVAMLTTAAPLWNNWARNPSFVVVMQDMLAYLSRRPKEQTMRVVGTPLEMSLDASSYKPQVRFIAPEESTSPTTNVDAMVAADGSLSASLSDMNVSGFYEAQLTRTDGTPEIRRYAVNVDPAEGDLTTVSSVQLATRLEGVVYHDEQASQFQFTTSDAAGLNLGETLLYVLILLLIGEQILAWSASYHPASRRDAAPHGDAA
jgi:hypothetical protein